MKFRLERNELYWILYDVGNSAFVMLVATILPIYFNFLAENSGLSDVEYLAYWGYATSISTFVVAVLGPVFGTLADTKGFKKPLFVSAILIGGAGCLALGFVKQWLLFLGVYVLAKIGFSVSLIFYDSMLPDISDSDRMDMVSSHGYAWGYIGSCIPFAICICLVLGANQVGLSMSTAMMLAFMITALWWIGMSVPLVKNYKQRNYIERRKHAVAASLRRLGGTFKNARKNKRIFLFLLAFFFYIDGVYTIIDMATAYGAALGLDSTGLLLALLVTQIVAFPFAILYGRLSRKISADKLITICVAGYIGIAVFAMFLHTQVQFWILAVLVGMFQGGIQALSRSYLAKLVPGEQSGEYFGLMDICGKGASFVGTAMVSVVSQATGKMNVGVGMIAVLFVIGLIIFRKVVKMND